LLVEKTLGFTLINNPVYCSSRFNYWNKSVNTQLKALKYLFNLNKLI